MANNEQPTNQTPPKQPVQPLYPEPTKGPLAENQAPASQPQEAVAAPTTSSPYNMTSLVLFGLLLLTFFTPLGPALFLPIVVIGFISAFRHVQKTTKQSGQKMSAPQSLLFTLMKVVMIIFAVIGLGFLALIGIFFLLISAGGDNFRMGS